MSAPTTSGDPAELDPLLARLADGDRSVFPQVFAQLWPPIHRLCRSLLKNEADAADAAQEALQKILERAPADYDRNRPALPWALAIAGWECRTLLRKRQRRRELPEQEIAEPSVDPEHSFVQQDLNRAALEALGSLSEVDRETLVATFWAEAASAPDAAPAATVRKRRQRALARLRDTFRRLYGLD
ncbi:MAG: sigma factor [Hyphomicrobium sp.]|uniref:RNA polymerase sigma factor n=1 Tax=Hyphomicrobium sp. TaxID=82 RepID=UPI0039E2D3D5